MTISVATREQLPIVRELAIKIWPTAYGAILSKAQLDYMLDLIYSIDSLEKQLENKHVFLLVKETDFIGFASYQLNFENTLFTKIQKIYVLPEIQGKGIGKKLIDFIKKIAFRNSNKALILNVNKYNTAKDFYLKIGFQVIDSVVIDIGNGFVMDDYVMKLEF